MLYINLHAHTFNVNMCHICKKSNKRKRFKKLNFFRTLNNAEMHFFVVPRKYYTIGG
jgi:hypothetical protein